MAAEKGNKGSIAWGRVFGAILPLVALVVLGMHQANFIAGRALLLGFPGLETTYKSARPTLRGNVVATNVVVYAPDQSEETAMRFERVFIDTPGLYWYLVSMFKKELPELDTLRAEFSNARSPAGLDYTLGDLSAFGVASASPFEAEGCREDDAWDADELSAMGLEPGPTRVNMEWKLEGRLLTFSEEVIVPNVSTARYRRLEQMDDSGINMLVLDYAGDSQVMSDRWEVEDAGFVAARNQHCADKDGVDAALFRQRHVAAVLRRLEAAGLAVGADAQAQYREFVEHGGRIALGGQYTRAMSLLEEYAETGWFETLPALGAFVDRGEESTPVAWRALPRRALDDGDGKLTTYAAMLRDGSLGLALAGPDLAKLPAAVLEAASVGVIADGGGVDALPAPTLASQDANAAPAALDSAAVAAAVSQPLMQVPAAAVKAEPPAPPPLVTERGAEIPFADLPKYAGRTLHFAMTTGKQRYGEVLAADRQAVEVRVRYSGGWATFSITRSELQRASVP